MARPYCSTSNRNASLSPERARSTALLASASIRPLDYDFGQRVGAKANGISVTVRPIMAGAPDDESLSTGTPEPGLLGNVRFPPKRSPAGYSQSVYLSVTEHRVD